jgi:hypothetical protein
MKRSTIVWGLFAAFAWSGVAWSQTLGDVAKKEEERRKSITAPGKSYTNDDLRRYPVTTPDPATPPAEAKPKAGEDTAGGAVDAKTAAPSVDLGEDYWRKLIGDARSTRARSTTYLEALDSRIRAMTAEFYGQEDSAKRAAVWAQRTRVLEDMERLKQDMTEQDKAISKIEEDARKANVPPGWIR